MHLDAAAALPRDHQNATLVGRVFRPESRQDEKLATLFTRLEGELRNE